MLITIVLTVIVVVGLVAVYTRIGGGSATLITAKVSDGGDFAKYFPDLVAHETEAMRALTPRATVDRKRYNEYLKTKFGSTSLQTSMLSIVVRDRTKIPPFLPIDISIEKQLLVIYLDKELSNAKKEDLAKAAKASIFNVPDLPDRTALHDIAADGRKTYFFYPRVQFDFSSKLNTPSELDRFEYLGIVLKVSDTESQQDAKVRIIDFQPKAADIVEFTRGELTQKAELDAKAAISSQGVSKVTKGTATKSTAGDTSSTGAEQTQTATRSPDVGLSMSETYVNALKDSIDARSAGILEEGRVFFAAFRSIKTKRIGGTYSFDLMLEVPSSTREEGNGVYSSQPCLKEVRVDASLIAVVRHVYKRGMTGWWTRVPEPDNDRTYLQVMTKSIKNLQLWAFSGVAWTTREAMKPVEHAVLVLTNRSDARFVVKDSDGKILGDGAGSSAKISLPPPSTNLQVHVEFLDVIEIVKDAVHVFSAKPSSDFSIGKTEEEQYTVVGTYEVKT